MACDYLRGLMFRRKFRKAGRITVGKNVIVRGGKNITLGDVVTLYDGVCLNAGNGFIRVGDETHVGQSAYLDGGGGLEIGNACAIGVGVRILTESNQYKSDPRKRVIDQPIVRGKVHIGDDVWIGANVVILPGVEIGDHAIVGAGAVVMKSIPEWAVAVGLPAKVIKDRRQGEIQK